MRVYLQKTGRKFDELSWDDEFTYLWGKVHARDQRDSDDDHEGSP